MASPNRNSDAARAAGMKRAIWPDSVRRHCQQASAQSRTPRGSAAVLTDQSVLSLLMGGRRKDPKVFDDDGDGVDVDVDVGTCRRERRRSSSGKLVQLFYCSVRVLTQKGLASAFAE